MLSEIQSSLQLAVKSECMQQKNEEAHRKNEVLLGHVLESVDSLARIAHAHEQRITGLEGGRQ